MATFPAEHRRLMACAHEPPMAGAVAWDHEGREPRPFERDQPSVCPGYTCSLPEVIEVVRARKWREHGELRSFCDGRLPTEALRDAIDLLDTEADRVEAWAARNPRDK